VIPVRSRRSFLRIPIAVFPFIVLGALAGWLGGSVRRRAYGRGGELAARVRVDRRERDRLAFWWR